MWHVYNLISEVCPTRSSVPPFDLTSGMIRETKYGLSPFVVSRLFLQPDLLTRTGSVSTSISPSQRWVHRDEDDAQEELDELFARSLK